METVRGFFGAATAAALVTLSANAIADENGDLGQREFEANCLVCHAMNGKGGAYAERLKSAPPDLSKLAANNGGVFPVARAYAVIDGRADVGGHGPSDMPVWGRDYQKEAAKYYFDMPYDPEVYVRGRILALIDYLSRVQDE